MDLDGTKSDSLKISTGVPQGSILGPLLFIIYINDLSSASTIFKPIMYADDTTLTTTLCFAGNPDYTAEIINESLDSVCTWLKVNKLSLNVKKTKFMIFHHANKNFIQPKLTIDQADIERVKSFNFLGLTLDENLSWKSHIDKVKAKIIRASGIINRLKNILPINVKVTLYNSLVLPHINYNLIIWGHQAKQVYKSQKRVLRAVSCSAYNAHSEPIFKALKLLKIEDIFCQSKLKFYHKFSNDKLPPTFNYLDFNSSKSIHIHDTRQK